MAATAALHNFIYKHDSRENVDFLAMAKLSNFELNDAYVGHNDPDLIVILGREKVRQRWILGMK